MLSLKEIIIYISVQGIRAERAKTCCKSALEMELCPEPNTAATGQIETCLVTVPHLECCRRSRAKKYKRAKHTQHLLGLCLDPVSAVSLSLEEKNPLQIQFLPSKPLSFPL